MCKETDVYATEATRTRDADEIKQLWGEEIYDLNSAKSYSILEAGTLALCGAIPESRKFRTSLITQKFNATSVCAKVTVCARVEWPHCHGTDYAGA
jgi:hypothetical protein